MANYGTDFDRKFEVMHYEIFTDDKGRRVLDLEFKLVHDLDNALQAIYNRLMTEYGEFELFQYFHFYNLVFNYLMTTNIPIAMEGMKVATKECLDVEPFVETVNDVNVVPVLDKRAFKIYSNITLVGGETFDIGYILRNDMSIDWISEVDNEIYEMM